MGVQVPTRKRTPTQVPEGQVKSKNSNFLAISRNQPTKSPLFYNTFASHIYPDIISYLPQCPLSNHNHLTADPNGIHPWASTDDTVRI